MRGARRENGEYGALCGSAQHHVSAQQAIATTPAKHPRVQDCALGVRTTIVLEAYERPCGVCHEHTGGSESFEQGLSRDLSRAIAHGDPILERTWARVGPSRHRRQGYAMCSSLVTRGLNPRGDKCADFRE
jgi:hypothetical protein